MTISDTQQNLPSIFFSFEELFKRPGHIIAAISVISVVLYQFQFNVTSGRTLIYIILLSTQIPVIYMENKWLNEIEAGNNIANRLYQRLKPFRLSFSITGIIMGILSIPIASVLIYTMVDYISEFNIENRRLVGSALLILIIVSYIISSIMALSFYRLKTQSSTSEVLKFYFTHPLQLFTLIAYTIQTMFLPLILVFEVFALYGQFIGSSLTEGLLPLDRVFFTSGGLQLLIPISIIVSVLVIINNAEHLIQTDGLRVQQFYQYRPFVTQFITSGILLLIFGYVSLNYSIFTNDLISFSFNVIVLMIPAVFYYFVKDYTITSNFCPQCQMILSDDQCEICNSSDDDFSSFRFLGRVHNSFGSKVKHPKCPNCKKPWDKLSRQCSNCNYTIILTCEKCSQTLNPLWTKCNRCGTKRKPIPFLAMDVPETKYFAVNRGKLILLAIFGYVLVISQLAIILNVNNNVDQPTRLNLTAPIGILIFGLFIILSVGYFIYRSRNKTERPVLLILTHLMFLPITLFFVSFFLNIIIYVWDRLFIQNAEFIITLILTVIILIPVILTLRNVILNYEHSKAVLNIEEISQYEVIE